MLSIIEYTASAGQQNFTIPFPYLERRSIHVYINDVETAAWTFISNTVIRLNVGAAESDIVTLRRITPQNFAVVDFTNGSNLDEQDLDAGVAQNLFILQELYELPADDVPALHSLGSHTDALPGQSQSKGTMRVYNEQGKWAAVDAPETGDILIGDTVVPEGVRFFPKGADGYHLEVDDEVGGKLKWVPGFKNIFTALGDLVYASAVGVVSRLGLGTKNQVLTAVPGSGPVWASHWETGDAKITWRATASAGWIKLNDGSIGPTGSSATTRANDDTEDLYKLVWANIDDTGAPVAGGRGASADADWLAGKLMTLPKELGRVLLIAGAGSGLTSRTLGRIGGLQDTTLPVHNHGVTDPTHAHYGYLTDPYGSVSSLPKGVGQVGTTNGVTMEVGVAVATGISINNAGSSPTDTNMPPWGAWNIMVKL